MAGVAVTAASNLSDPLFGLRVAARRPRRVVLNTISIAVSASGIVAVLMVHAHFDACANAGLADPQNARLSQVVTVISVALVMLAAVNVILGGWSPRCWRRSPQWPPSPLFRPGWAPSVPWARSFNPKPPEPRSSRSFFRTERGSCARARLFGMGQREIALWGRRLAG